MNWRSAGKRSLSWIASLALCAGGVGMAVTAPAAEPEAKPIYLDTSYTFAERAADLVSRMTLTEKASQLGNQSAAIPRLGVKEYNYWSEALHGVARSGEATVFPTGYGIAQTWNRDLVQQMMDVTSDEARAYNNEKGKGLSYWSPTINMSRDPRWGRTEETYGEDPYLTTEIGSSFVKGLEGTDEETPYLKAIATVKHYAANNSEYNRHNGSSNMDDRTLREYYTRAFKGVVQNTGVHSAMTSYNRINEIPSVANTYTIDTLLRRTFGFDGYVTSDCGAINDVYQNHKWQPDGYDHAVDAAEATALSIIAGTDLDCGGVYKGNAVAAVQRGLMSEDDLDVALVRAFTARMETGEFDDASLVPYRSDEYSWNNQICAPDHTAIAQQASEEAVALLKNEPAAGESNALLPLDASKINKLVVFGDNQLVKKAILGDYSGTPKAENQSTPLDGITTVLKSLNPDATVSYVDSTSTGASYFCNFKNFDLKAADGSVKKTLTPKDAAAYANCKIEGGGNFGYVYNKMWVKYENVNLDGVSKISVQASGDKNNATHGTFEIRLDSKTGPMIGSIVSEPTSGWNDFKTFTGDITVPQTGSHTLYIVGNSGAEFTPFSEADQKTIREADAVIAYVGTRQADSAEENDRGTLVLPRFQADMVEAIAGLNPRTVAYVSSVGQVSVEEFKEKVPSILWCTYNGQAQGVAAGNLLFGQANPSGKLTFTWYSDEEELPVIGDYNIYTTDTSKGRTYQYFSGKVSYPFGHGLSYTSFTYSDMTVSKTAATPDDTLTVSVKVKNSGSVEGQEVVQAYVSSPLADKSTRPAKQLKGFEKISLKAGETKTVTMELPIKDWYFWDEAAGKNIYDQGNWTVEIGSSSGDIRDHKTVAVSGELTPVLQTVSAIPSGHTLDLSDREITTDLTAAMSNDSFTDLSKATVVYTSSDESVAKVDANGTVHSVAPGAATITAKVTVNGVTKESGFPVVVKNELSLSQITVNGKPIENFSPTTYQYNCILEDDAKQAVVAVPSHGDGVTINIVQAASIPGTATVTATSGDLKVVYTIYIRQYHEPVSTDFAKLSELPADWRVYDNGKNMGENPDNWKLTEGKGLTITTEAGDVYQGHNNSQNIFIQDADGDWVVDAKLTKSEEFKGGYQQCGVMVFQDEDNYLKIGGESGNRLKVIKEIGQSSTEMQPQNGGLTYVSLTYYFRIVKNGDSYAFYYSEDEGQTYTLITKFDAKLSNVKLALTAVSSFNGTPAPIDVTFEYLNVYSMKDCTCDLKSLTFDDQTVDLQEAVIGYKMTAKADIESQGCTVPGHDTQDADYTFSLKKDGENTAGATISGNVLTALGKGVVDVTVTATLLNGKTMSKDARLTIKNTDPNLVGWFFKDETASKDTHTMVVSQSIGSPINLAPYAGRTLYLEYDVKVNTTHTNPAPANDDWVKYIVNGWVKMDGVKVSDLGYNATPPSFTANDSWTSFKIELPETIVSKGELSAIEFLTYNDTGTKYPADPGYVDNGITWSNDTGAIMSVRNVKITAEPLAVDKTELKTLLDGKKTDLSAYTDASVTAYNKLFENAQAVYDDPAATQEDIDAQVALLKDADKVLIEKEPSGAEKDQLNELIKQADDVDTTEYDIPQLVTAFENALQAAKTVSGDNAATQEEVDQAYKDLDEAKSALRSLGDVNGNGKITAEDALQALQAATKKITLSDAQQLAANVDGKDGVTATDALLILQHATKKIDKF